MMWKESLKIGEPTIDSEHKELCDKIDELFAACNQGKGKDEIFRIVEFLQSYAIKHFQDEEAIQRKCGYPKLKEHKEKHDFFTAKVAEVKKDMELHGVSIATVSQTNYFLMDWLLDHIQKVDAEIGQYIK